MEKNTVLNQCVSGSVFQSQASHFTHPNSSHLTSLDLYGEGGGGGRALHGWGPHQASEKKAEIERELGHIIFDVCGVPGTPKNTVLISHEHLDHVPFPLDLLRSYGSNLEVLASSDTVDILDSKLGFRLYFKVFKIREVDTKMLYSVGDILTLSPLK